MRFIITPKSIALLITCVIAFVAVADANAYCWIVAFVGILASDGGVTYANANALSNDDPNIVTGISGLALGSLITISGALALSQVEEPWQFGLSAGMSALGVASIVYGWRVIRSSRQQEDVAQDGRSVRLIPMLSLGDRSERQIGLVFEVSY